MRVNEDCGALTEDHRVDRLPPWSVRHNAGNLKHYTGGKHVIGCTRRGECTEADN